MRFRGDFYDLETKIRKHDDGTRKVIKTAELTGSRILLPKKRNEKN